MITKNTEITTLNNRRERIGWYCYDWANSAFATTVVTVFLGPYLTAIAKTAAGCATDSPCDHGVIHPLGLTIAPGSLFAYTVSLSVLLTVFVLPVVGAIADRSSHKKQLLAACAYLGATATTGLVLLTDDRYLLGAALFLVANIAFGASIVVYNSFLPQLATPDQRDRVSSIGWAIGYLGGATLLLLNVIAVLTKDTLGLTTAEVARYSIVSAGLWWAAFTTIPLRRLNNRPAPAGPPTTHPLTDGFRQLRQTLQSLKTYPLTLFFLIAYLIYNDGIQTVIALAGTYATEELNLPDDVLVPTILMVQFLAFFGALGLGALSQRIGAWKTILLSLILWIAIILATVKLPAGQAIPFVILGGAIGLVLGGSQALSRSLFSQLIPAGRGRRVLRPLRDLRQGHQLARPPDLRNRLRRHPQLPSRDHLTADLLHHRLRRARSRTHAPSHRRRRQHAPTRTVKPPTHAVSYPRFHRPKDDPVRQSGITRPPRIVETNKNARQIEGEDPTMGERMLRGSRLGAVSYESDRNTELAPRQTREYLCAKGHRFEVPFAVDAEVPITWECRFDGSIGRLVDGNEPEQKKAKPPRTHWDMLLERRSIAELEDILAERLAEIRTRRGRSA